MTGVGAGPTGDSPHEELWVPEDAVGHRLQEQTGFVINRATVNATQLCVLLFMMHSRSSLKLSYL